MSTKFTIRSSAMERNLARFDTRARTAIKGTLDYQATKSETWMRTNARWTDRTTNARNGLFGTVLDNGVNSWVLLLSHGVDYGIWLEVIESGKYAIVRPAWLRTNREVMRLLARVFERMEGGR